MRLAHICRRTTCLLLFIVVPLVATSCSSGTGSSDIVVATGSVTCSNVTGSVSFSPPLTMSGGSAEHITIALTTNGCTTSGSNIPTLAKGSVATTISMATNACSSLLSPQPVTVTETWIPATIHQSVVSYSGYKIGLSPSGGGGFTLPNSGGTAKVVGSFAGSDHGSGSTAALYSTESATELLTACGSDAGLASLPVTSGSVTLK